MSASNAPLALNWSRRARPGMWSRLQPCVLALLGCVAGPVLADVQVVSATYGGNCGAAQDNALPKLRSACDGTLRCSYTIDYQVLGDPVPGCAKSFDVQWTCVAGGTPKQLAVPPEAGFKTPITLSCRVRRDVDKVQDADPLLPRVAEVSNVVGIEAHLNTSSPVEPNASVGVSWHLTNTTPLQTAGVVEVFLDGTPKAIQGTLPPVSLAAGGVLEGQFTLRAPQQAGTHVLSMRFLRDTGDQITRITPDGKRVTRERREPSGSTELEFSVRIPAILPSMRELAVYWAPVVSQDIDSANVRADYMTAIDFDGDWAGRNNWDHIDQFDLPPVAYYWVLEAADRYFIGYAFFHPRDWSTLGSGQHENDLEGALLSIRKAAGQPHGRFEAMITIAHGPLFTFVDNNTRAESPWFSVVSLSRDLQEAGDDIDGDVDFVVDDVGVHPVVYMQAEGHGAYGGPRVGPHWHNRVDDYAPVFIENRITDWRGADWAGVVAPPRSGAVNQSYDSEPWGDGIIFHYEGAPDNAASVAGSSPPNDFRVVGYALVSIEKLWARRRDFETEELDVRTFDGYGQFTENGADAPWNWSGDRGSMPQGVFFNDPARLMDYYLQNWNGGSTSSCAYIANSFGAPPGSCPQ